MNIEEIHALIPHRYPFLLVDRMFEVEPGVRGRGVKNVSANESYFQGHFPGKPIMPGVLLLEAMAQVAVVVLLCAPENEGKFAYLAGADKVRFRRPVVPGDCLVTEVESLWRRGNHGRVRAVGTVDGMVVVEGEITYSLAGLWQENLPRSTECP